MTSVFRRVTDNERNPACTLFVGNLDSKVTETLLYELFIQFASVRTLNLPKDRVLRTHQGFGFVEFKTEQETDYVVKVLKGVRLYGKLLRIRPVEQNKTGSGSGSGGHQSIGTTNGKANNRSGSSAADVGAKIFINGLNKLIDEKYLQDTFSSFGKMISTPLIVRDPNTAESKGHGFITFGDFASSDKAIAQMDGKLLMNSKVNVTYAYKEGTNLKVKHGDKVERLLAENAKRNRVIETSDHPQQSKKRRKHN